MSLDGKSPTSKRESLSARAYEEIRKRIVEGTIPPGYPVLEADLASELNISRTPVREALARLKQENLITYIPRKGIYASSVSVKDMQEIYEAIEGLEGMAVKLATLRATEEDFRRLDEAVARQEAAIANEDFLAWIIADEDLHFAVVEAARNDFITGIITRVNDHLRRARRITVKFRRNLKTATEMHKATVAAMKAGDAELARDINQRHRASMRPELIQIITAVTDGREWTGRPGD